MHVRNQIFILLLLLPFICSAQDSLYLVISGGENDKEIAAFLPGSFFRFSTAAEREIYLARCLDQLYAKGYLTAAWNTISDKNDSLTISFEKGRKVYWAGLQIDPVDIAFLSAAGIQTGMKDNTIFRYDALLALFKEITVFAENNGYPFASVKLDSIIWTDTLIHAKLLLKKNQLILFDSLRTTGDLSVNKNYLEQYTGIRQGDPYDQRLIDNLDGRLKELAFASLTKTSKIEFSGNTARVIIHLDARQSSRFDFIVGVLPNTEITGRFIVTGEGRLDLQNVFSAGEQVNLHFSKLESTSKELQVHALYPYLPGLPLGLEGSFNLFLRDSAYLEQSATAGILYQFAGAHNLKGLVNFYNSIILNVDTGYIITYHTLPSSLDVNIVSYGLEWNFEHLNYKFNPRNGFSFQIGAAAGTKKIKENSMITGLLDPGDPAFDFTSLYDTLELESPSYRYNYDVKIFIPVLKRSTIMLQGRGASMINTMLLENELFKIGGNSLLRGFDERSMPVSQYHILTAELRYLLSQNSFASLFADGGYTENVTSAESVSAFPVGFGAGINFETKAGIFGLSYALGFQEGNPLSIKNTKIHFGYVNYF